MAQIAINTLSLSGLSQTHWVAKGLLVFSLTSALMAVYYATTQHRALGENASHRVLFQSLQSQRPKCSLRPLSLPSLPVSESTLALHGQTSLIYWLPLMTAGTDPPSFTLDSSNQGATAARGVV